MRPSKGKNRTDWYVLNKFEILSRISVHRRSASTKRSCSRCVNMEHLFAEINGDTGARAGGDDTTRARRSGESCARSTSCMFVLTVQQERQQRLEEERQVHFKAFQASYFYLMNCCRSDCVCSSVQKRFTRCFAGID